MKKKNKTNISEQRESLNFNINVFNIKIIDDEQSSYEEKEDEEEYISIIWDPRAKGQTKDLIIEDRFYWEYCSMLDLG